MTSAPRRRGRTGRDGAARPTRGAAARPRRRILAPVEKPGNAPPEGGGGAPPPSRQQSEDAVLLVLSYVGLLALVPYLVAKDREPIRFHARQGLALALLQVGCAGITAIPVIGFVGALGLVLSLVLAVVGIVKALGRELWRMPVAADLADRLDL